MCDEVQYREEYHRLRLRIRQDIKDLALLRKFIDNTYEPYEYHDKENVFYSHLLDRIEENLLKLDDLTREVNKNEK